MLVKLPLDHDGFTACREQIGRVLKELQARDGVCMPVQSLDDHLTLATVALKRIQYMEDLSAFVTDSDLDTP